MHYAFVAIKSWPLSSIGMANWRLDEADDVVIHLSKLLIVSTLYQFKIELDSLR